MTKTGAGAIVVGALLMVAAVPPGAGRRAVGSGEVAITKRDPSGDVDAATMTAWIRKMVSFGIRRPGYPADDKAAKWIAGEFRRAGLQKVRREPVRLNRWTPGTCRVSWWSDVRPTQRSSATCFALPYSDPHVDLTARLGADDGKVSLHGAIGVVRDRFATIPQQVIASQALAVVAPASFVATDQQPIPFGVRNRDLFADFFTPTTSRGGVGMIGILEGLGSDRYYAPYTGEHQGLPAVWLGEQVGARLRAAMDAGATTARIQVSARREVVTSSNVIGELPATSNRWVVVGSHHDAPWASAVEDASGISEVLAQAHHWAAVPRARRPHKLLFLASAGHMAGAAGSAAFVARHPKLLDQTVLEVHLEHIARRAEMTPTGLHVTDAPETRWWFTTRRPDLQSLVAGALRAQGLDRDLVLPAVGFFGGNAPLSDAAPFSLAHVPVVSLITTPLFLFDPRDTPDKVDTEALTGVRDATVRMIASTAGLTTTRTSDTTPGS